MTIKYENQGAGPADHAGREGSLRASLYEGLLRAITQHMEAEAASIEEYRRLADGAKDPLVRMLMRLLLEDESRHHDLFLRMASTLDQGSAHDPGSLLPLTPQAEWRPSMAEMAGVRRLIEEERENVGALKGLAEEHRSMFSGLFSALLELMATDSGKHERILALVLGRMEDQRRITTAFQAERVVIHDALARTYWAREGGPVNWEALADIVATVRRHVYAEEEHLYPRLDKDRFAASVEQARYNHGRVWALLDAIEAEARADTPAQQMSGKIRDLIDVLEAHDRLEQFVLYPALEDTLGKDELVRLYEELESASPPPGWACRERG